MFRTLYANPRMLCSRHFNTQSISKINKDISEDINKNYALKKKIILTTLYKSDYDKLPHKREKFIEPIHH